MSHLMMTAGGYIPSDLGITAPVCGVLLCTICFSGGEKQQYRHETIKARGSELAAQFAHLVFNLHTFLSAFTR